MNAMTQALKTAGVKTPSNNQRIWQWLKDNGMHTVDAVSKALGIQKQSAQAAMHDLLVRGMVEKHKRVDARLSPLASNYEALGKEYELLPRPVAAKKAPKPEKRNTATTALETTREQIAQTQANITYATLTLRVPRGVAKVYEEHAKEFGVGVDDVMRLALEAYGKKMGLPMMALDPTQALRKKLEGGV